MDTTVGSAPIRSVKVADSSFVTGETLKVSGGYPLHL